MRVKGQVQVFDPLVQHSLAFGKSVCVLVCVCVRPAMDTTHRCCLQEEKGMGKDVGGVFVVVLCCDRSLRLLASLALALALALAHCPALPPLPPPFPPLPSPLPPFPSLAAHRQLAVRYAGHPLIR